MNRRGFMKGLAALGAVMAVPFKAEASLRDVRVTMEGNLTGLVHYAVSQCHGERRYFMDGYEVEPTQVPNLDILDRWQLEELEGHLPAPDHVQGMCAEVWANPQSVYWNAEPVRTMRL